MKPPFPPFFIFILLFCCGLSPYAIAQQWAFERLGTDRGLPASETYNMFRDDRGYVHVATEYGMVKYNGNRFVPVCVNIPMRERVAYAFYKNAEGGHCFVNSQFHIYTIRSDSAFRLQIKGKIVPAIPHYSPIKQLFADSTGNIYASTPYNGFKYDVVEGKWTSIQNQQLPVNTIFIEKIYHDYLSRFQYERNSRIVVHNTGYAGAYRLESQDIMPFLNVKESDQGLYMFGKRRILHITKQKKVQSYHTQNNILSLNISVNGHIWVGTQYSGLLELDPDLHLLHRYLEHLSIADVLFDGQEGAWVTSLEQGVFHCKNMHEYHYDNLSGFSGEISVLKTINNRLFAGAANGNLLMISPEGNRVMRFGQRTIRDIIPWGEGYLIANGTSISFLSPSFRTSIVVPQLASYLLLPKQDDLLCVGPSAFFLYSKKYTLKHYSFSQKKIKCLLPLGNDTLLAGSTKGLLLFRNDSLSIPSSLYLLRNSSIADLEKSKDGAIWIGTKGDGLFLLTGGRRLVKVPAPSDIITNVSFFKDSILLLSTNTGLYARLYAAQAPEWRSLYDGEVLDAIPYHNKIFVGAKHGLIALDTAQLFYPGSYPVYLSSLTSGGRRVDTTGIRLTHREHDLYFNFDVLSYSRQAPPLHYRLDGPIASKGQMSGTQLFLQNLEPGHYALYIYLGAISKQPALTVPFYIKPAFWQTNLFLLLMIIACLCLLTGSAYLLYRRTKRTAYKKAAIRRMLSEYKLTALKAQINPHFISNSLTAIQQLVLSDEVDKAGRYLALFSQLIRQVLQYSDQSLVLLHEELKIIELNVTLEQLRFSNQFHFELDIAADVHPLALFIPPLITQPFIENAIWHGLLPLKDTRPARLLIKIFRSGSSLVLSVIDNGVGRKTVEEHVWFPNSKGASRGIALTQSRIENLNQLYIGGKAHIQFTDLFENAAPAGTQVDIILPYLPDIIYDNYHQERHH